MAKIKNILKAFLPPVIFYIFNIFKTKKVEIEMKKIWSGDYDNWANAKLECTGYDSANILEKCKTALLKVKSGEAVYERDSVLFDKVQYSLGLLSGLLKVAIDNEGKLCVLDFGGSLGSTYYQNKEFLYSIKDLNWCIIEQRNFVDCGKEYFENEQLKFYSSIDECMNYCQPNVIILSGVLQYLEKPYEWIEKFVSLGINNIIFDRTAFVNFEDDLLTVQKVPEEIYSASYPAWFFNEEKVLKQFKGYSSLVSFESYCDCDLVINSIYHASWKGHILKRIN